MNMSIRLRRVLFLAAIVLAGDGVAGNGIALGQTNPYGARPVGPAYYPGYPGGFYPGRVGGAYYGAADLVRAQGELTIQTEQARQEREKANQAKLETKRKSFEEMMYEKANTPTLTENLQYEAGLSTQRLITSPMPAEITAGKTLNAMTPMIVSLAMKGTQGPVIPLSQDMLRHINVTIGKGGATIGMLSDGGSKLDWPLALQGPKQQKIAALIPNLVSQAGMGAVDAKLYREVTSQLNVINEELRKKFHKEEIDGGEFLEARRFLDSLTQSVQALRSPTSQRFLDGSYAAKGNTVPELAENMVKSGLSFAPANPGDTAYYQALHDMFVAYTTSAQAAAGFQVRYNPPRTDPWKVK
ncbi:MAG: hypothetical protein L0Y71_21845 [Gemmataceae bacterium]|nr:hypothetical protein [Gemmataceae bacterium]